MRARLIVCRANFRIRIPDAPALLLKRNAAVASGWMSLRRDEPLPFFQSVSPNPNPRRAGSLRHR